MVKHKIAIENIRHSLAHLLAAAVLKKFPKAKLGIGPTIENGFYYDFLLPRTLTPDDLKEFEKTMRELIAQKLLFSGKKLTTASAKKLFRGQPFKLDLIKEFAKDKKPLTAYITGHLPKKLDQKSLLNSKFYILNSLFVDLCRGGHVKNTGEINPDAFKLDRLAGAYWRGKEKNPQLQRIYGLAFETKKELDDYLQMRIEVERRDHRKLGERLDLFHFENIAPGAAFWHGPGMIIWRELEKFMREKLDRDDYEEISTPVMVKKDVFEKSGHFQHFRESMFYFSLPGEPKEVYVLKPMNCPESTYVYNFRIRSYRDLPLRLSEITNRLHRNELSGTLGGLFRVRQMTQDDAHIYCRPDQIEPEVLKLIDLVGEVYKYFDLPLSFNLATRPDKAMGAPKLWKRAEAALAHALKSAKAKYELKPKDGAFYGPKIDVNAKDSLGREWTIATIQLDFQLAERFNLHYVNKYGKKERPVVIHRAILGTFERFIGIILEHFEGKLPLWLSPIQAEVINVGAGQKKYAEEVRRKLKDACIRVSLSDENLTVGKRIREAEMRKIPYILVVGEREEKNGTVNVRHYRRGRVGELATDKLIAQIKGEIEKKTI